MCESLGWDAHTHNNNIHKRRSRERATDSILFLSNSKCKRVRIISHRLLHASRFRIKSKHWWARATAAAEVDKMKSSGTSRKLTQFENADETIVFFFVFVRWINNFETVDDDDRRRVSSIIFVSRKPERINVIELYIYIHISHDIIQFKLLHFYSMLRLLYRSSHQIRQIITIRWVVCGSTVIMLDHLVRFSIQSKYPSFQMEIVGRELFWLHLISFVPNDKLEFHCNSNLSLKEVHRKNHNQPDSNIPIGYTLRLSNAHETKWKMW